MAWSAVANGGGVASGGFVATLQSTGAAGLGLGTKLALGGTAGGIYSYLFRSREENDVGWEQNRDNLVLFLCYML